MSYQKTGAGLATIGDAAKVANYVLTVPYLPRISQHLMRLHELEVQSGVESNLAGVGLKHVEKPLSWYVWYREQPLAGPLAVAGLIAIPFVVGYLVGKR